MPTASSPTARTPLAQTVRADGGVAGGNAAAGTAFFPSSSQGNGAGDQSSNQTSNSTTNAPSHSALSYELSQAQAEAAHLRREVQALESHLSEKDASISKLASSLHKMEVAKVAAESRARATIAELKNRVSEAEARVKFIEEESVRVRERDAERFQKHTVALIDSQNKIVETVGETLKQSSTVNPASAATLSPSSAASVGASPTTSSPSPSATKSPSTGALFSPTGSSMGMSHEAFLKHLHGQWSAERSKFDESRRKELEKLREEFRAKEESYMESMRKTKLDHATAHRNWERIHAALENELDTLAEYTLGLTTLLQAIDEGTFPVTEKNGVKKFKLPRKERAQYLAVTQVDSGESNVAFLRKKLETLRKKMVELHLLAPGAPLLPRDGDEGEEAEESEGGSRRQSTQKLLMSPQAAQKLLTSGGSGRGSSGSEAEEESKVDEGPMSTALVPTSNADNDADLDAAATRLLDSHQTLSYISHLEQERDRYREALHLETRRKIELQHTLKSQARLLESSEIVRRAKVAQTGPATHPASKDALLLSPGMSSTSTSGRESLRSSGTFGGGPTTVTMQRGRGPTSPLRTHKRRGSSLDMASEEVAAAIAAGSSPPSLSPSQQLPLHTASSFAANQSRSMVAAGAHLPVTATGTKVGLQPGIRMRSSGGGASGASSEFGKVGQQVVDQDSRPGSGGSPDGRSSVGLTSGSMFNHLNEASSQMSSPSRPISSHKIGQTSGAYRSSMTMAGSNQPTVGASRGGASSSRPVSAIVSPSANQIDQQRRATTGDIVDVYGNKRSTTSVGNRGSSSSSNAYLSPNYHAYSRPESAVTTHWTGQAEGGSISAGTTRPTSAVMGHYSSSPSSRNSIGPISPVRSSHTHSSIGSPTAVSSAATGPASPPSSFPKPLPLHLTQGNVGASLLPHQLASTSIKQKRDSMLGQGQGQSGPSILEPLQADGHLAPPPTIPGRRLSKSGLM